MFELSNISLDSLKIFAFVAKEKNITKASKVLYISQPAITQTINKLESQLNTKLFIRQPKGVELTESGKRVFEKVVNAFNNLKDINEIVHDENNFNFGTINIVSGTYISKTLLTKPIVSFNKQYNNVTINIIDKMQSIALENLKMGEVDLVVGNTDSKINDPLTFIPLIKEEHVVVCGKNYNKSIVNTYIVMPHGSTNRNVFEKYLQQNNISKYKIFEVSGYNMLLELVKENVGIGILPNYIVEAQINSGEIEKLNSKPLNSTTYGLIYNKNNVSKALAKFLEYFN